MILSIFSKKAWSILWLPIVKCIGFGLTLIIITTCFYDVRNVVYHFVGLVMFEAGLHKGLTVSKFFQDALYSGFLFFLIRICILGFCFLWGVTYTYWVFGKGSQPLLKIKTVRCYKAKLILKTMGCFWLWLCIYGVLVSFIIMIALSLFTYSHFYLLEHWAQGIIPWPLFLPSIEPLGTLLFSFIVTSIGIFILLCPLTFYFGIGLRGIVTSGRFGLFKKYHPSFWKVKNLLGTMGLVILEGLIMVLLFTGQDIEGPVWVLNLWALVVGLVFVVLWGLFFSSLFPLKDERGH